MADGERLEASSDGLVLVRVDREGHVEGICRYFSATTYDF